MGDHTDRRSSVSEQELSTQPAKRPDQMAEAARIDLRWMPMTSVHPLIPFLQLNDCKRPTARVSGGGWDETTLFCRNLLQARENCLITRTPSLRAPVPPLWPRRTSPGFGLRSTPAVAGGVHAVLGGYC